MFSWRAPIILGACVALLAAAPAAGAHPYKGLRDLAARRGLAIGTAVDANLLANEVRYRAVLAREFSSVTPENAMKWESVEAQRGVLDFSAADAIVGFARRHGQQVRGHTLVWHNQLPAWLAQGTFTSAELEAILRQHILDEARHFRGRVKAWDVVNEPFNEDGTWRDTLWLRALGPDYVAKALQWAHEADPRAKLYLNDYNLEAIGPKSDAMYALVQDLLRRGVPLHGVGFQGHLALQYPYPDSLSENLRRFAALGLDVAITEADVRMLLPVTPEKLAAQASAFAGMLRSCLAVRRRCPSYTVWGFTDAASWVPGVFPGEGAATPFDEELRPKPAYFALRDTLAGYR